MRTTSSRVRAVLVQRELQRQARRTSEKVSSRSVMRSVVVSRLIALCERLAKSEPETVAAPAAALMTNDGVTAIGLREASDEAGSVTEMVCGRVMLYAGTCGSVTCSSRSSTRRRFRRGRPSLSPVRTKLCVLFFLPPWPRAYWRLLRSNSRATYARDATRLRFFGRERSCPSEDSSMVKP